MHAARRGFVTVCKVLVDHGADVWAKSVDGKMAIDFCDGSAPTKAFLDREMRRYLLWKAWACADTDVLRGSFPKISVHDDVLKHVLYSFPEDLFKELVSYV